VVDTLKNPCLDYVEHIVFAGPHATFEAAGTVYPSRATAANRRHSPGRGRVWMASGRVVGVVVMLRLMDGVHPQ